MSKDEAWETLDGRGRRASEHLFVLDFQPFDINLKLSAELHFDEDRLLYIYISDSINSSYSSSPSDCIALAVSVSRQIQTRYQVRPTRRLLRSGLKYDVNFGLPVRHNRERLDFIDVFSFDGAASIEMKVVSDF